MANDRYDLIVIGSGPGGYVAAARAAQLGMKTACVERYERPGGVCLNVGCIPSKVLLDSSEYYDLAKNRFGEHGIGIKDVTLDLPAMMKRKEQVVRELTDNVRQLLEGNKVDIVHGTARLSGKGKVTVTPSDGNGEKELEAENILLATGSKPVSVPGIDFDGERIVSSTEALSLTSVPEHLGVIGGGYIGLELGLVWARLGAKVTIIEMLPQIAAGLDGQVARTLLRILKTKNMEFRLKTKVTRAQINGEKVTVSVESGDKQDSIECDRLLVAVGRKPLTESLGLEDAGVEIDSGTGFIRVDETLRTSVSGVYAIGDLVPGPMLAHKASAEGVAAVENMAGQAGEVNYDAIPFILYTWPEVAGVGLTEEQAKEHDIPYCTGTYPFKGAGRARCMGETDGFVKVLAHQKTDRILGVHIIGPRASDMIAECVLAVEFGASAEDIARTIHGHPTFAEALQEAAKGVIECSIYGS